MALFDAVNFNGEVFQRYVDSIPNPNKTELLKSRAIRQRQDIADAMAQATGGNYFTSPLTGLLTGSTPVNYDGNTDIDAHSTETYTHSRIVVGRANAWKEKDFSADITGGQITYEIIARQIAEYWDEIDQATIVHILKGVFAMTDAQGKAFIASHSYDITKKPNTDGTTGLMDATTLNTAGQKACGDNKSAFSLAIMHSVVATNLENQNLLTYIKYNDANGMLRDTNLATINGKLVLIDDSMPTSEVSVGDGTATQYTTYLLGDGAIEYTNCGAERAYEMDRDPKTAGGQTLLYSRQRKCWAPYGISFTKASMATLSPTDAELENGANWELVSTNGDDKKYISPKMIPIGQVLSLG